MIVSIVLYFHFCFSNAASSVITVSPVYSRNSKNTNVSDSVEVVVGSMYRVEHPNIQSRTIEISENLIANQTEEDEYIVRKRLDCWNHNNSLTSCWQYQAVKFIQDLTESPGIDTLSDNVVTWNQYANGNTYLIALPSQTANASQTFLSRSTGLEFGELFEFFERLFMKFISKHGVIFPLQLPEEGVNSFSTPIYLNNGVSSNEGRSERRTKKKSILFPMLVLFKFFKIKMILIPILLTVLLVKKLLILTLTLAPNLIGLFRLCRPGFGTPVPPFGLASAGILQDLSDSRGEFSTLHNTYANLYRDPHGYRTRDFSRYTSQNIGNQVDAPINSPDY